MDTKSRIRDTRLETRIQRPESQNQTIYTEEIIDLYKYPENKKENKNADIKYQDENPSCGDDITIYITLDETKKKIKEITWTGKGCAISQATAEKTSQEYKKATIKKAKNITQEQITKLIHTPLGPVRIKCAMLAPTAIKKGIINWEKVNSSQSVRGLQSTVHDTQFTVNSSQTTVHRKLETVNHKRGTQHE